MEKHLHIITLDVPYPVDYGGVYDLFYKLGALQQQGVHIHLHCFDNGRSPQPELNKYCAEVYYYPRRTGHQGISPNLPYIVSSRINQQLIERLAQDDYPVFMEGVHCTYPLLSHQLAGKRFFVRQHNVEHVYYRQLFETTTSLFKKTYYWWESRRLLHYEQSIVDKATFWGVSHSDVAVYRQMGCANIDFLPLFLPEWQVSGQPGRGTFCLYHGNLSVDENEKAATWLLEEVFSKMEVPFVVAGKNPPRRLKQLAHSRPHTCIVENPSQKEMQDMVAKAHINVLPSFNATGIKLKLINALYNGRHCLVNAPAAEGTGLETACYLADNAAEFCASIQNLLNQPFEASELNLRHSLLQHMFNNQANARQMVQWIWGNGA